VKPWLAGVGAVAAGFAVTVISSVATDAVMHGTGLFAITPRKMTDALFALAAGYRAIFTIAGGYVTARLAPSRPMRYAMILAAIGLCAGLAGLALFYSMPAGELGPAWYAIAIPLEAIPCVWLGAWLAGRRRASSSGRA
jgi:hypothetical protein